MFLYSAVLREQIEKLKQQTGAGTAVSDGVVSESHKEIAWLKEQLLKKESEMAEIKRLDTVALSVETLLITYFL